ncbi:MAG: hypothetical protein LBQ77_08505 [Treponema sp.]|nr:hypothetical protein [Treponema sp.]
MRDVVNTVFFFIISFLILFLLSVLVQVVLAVGTTVAVIPALPLSVAAEGIRSFPISSSAAYCMSLLVTYLYTTLQRTNGIKTFVCLLIVGTGSILGATVGIAQLKNTVTAPIPAQTASTRFENAGTILYDSDGTPVVTLTQYLDDERPRLLVNRDGSSSYQQGPFKRLFLLPPPEKALAVSGIWEDFERTAATFERYYHEDLILLALYGASLTFLFLSFVFAVRVHSWSLVTFFLSILVFRAVLFGDRLLESEQIRAYIDRFTATIPELFLFPALFCALGLILLLINILVHIRKRSPYD